MAPVRDWPWVVTQWFSGGGMLTKISPSHSISQWSLGVCLSAYGVQEKNERSSHEREDAHTVLAISHGVHTSISSLSWRHNRLPLHGRTISRPWDRVQTNPWQIDKWRSRQVVTRQLNPVHSTCAPCAWETSRSSLCAHGPLLIHDAFYAYIY
jgi:hypothetical protein